MKDLSIIIPVFNEEENLSILHSKILDVMQSINLDYEIIYIDDGSSDNSYKILLNLKSTNVKIIKFRKNFGQTPAMQAGIDNSSGKIIIPLDADMQNDPNDIPKLIKMYNNGYDLVSGWRKKRHDNIIRVIPSKIANLIISRFTGTNLHDTGCTLKAYNGEILRSIKLFGEQHRFIPAIFSEYSDKITEVEVNHNPRLYGQSKYNFSRITKVIFDLLAISYWKKYKDRPIYFWGKFSATFVLLQLISIFALIINILTINSNYSNIILSICLIFFILSGFFSFAIGLIFESILRNSLQNNKVSIYTIENIL